MIQMPRYNYECDNCGNVITVFHSFQDAYTDCSACKQKNTMKKLLSVPFIIKNDQTTTQNNEKVGDLTKEHIEANREILKQQKESKKETYEPS